MSKSKVYFIDYRTDRKNSLLRRLQRLITTAGMDDIDFDKKFTAIKMHFGEPGNLAYLRANYAKVVADEVKKRGGIPFVTDCSTLYVGRRSNAIDHLETAYENGFSPFSAGCQVLIGDGLKGTDEALIDIEGEYIRQAKIGRVVADSDVIISLTHFKMHEGTGIGGAMKNIGMGCGSKDGKADMHAGSKPRVNADICIGCHECEKNCAHGAFGFSNGKAYIVHSKCKGCGRCISTCRAKAIKHIKESSPEVLCKKIAEYTLAVLKNKPSLHVSLIQDVSPFCDCHPKNDIPVVADIGMLASTDVVALDLACVELVNKQPVMPGSILAEIEHSGDHFNDMHPTTNWRSGVEHAQKIGLGSMDYELIEI